MAGVRGAAEFSAALQTQMLAARAVTDLAVTQAAQQVGRNITDELMRKEHPHGTPTPSAPGEPPAMITGRLKASVTVEPTRAVGSTRFEARVGPTAVYARIQELGGTAGHGAQLPARPYVRPALEASRAQVAVIFRAAWSALGRL